MVNLPRSLALGLALVACAANPARALDPQKFLSQYGHTAWRTQDGYVAPPAMITQTTDGYIWIGTTAGLVRFDGVRFTIWTPPIGQTLPTRGFGPLLGARDGTLWIGTTGGLYHMKDGQVSLYDAEHAGYGVTQIMEDKEGTIWFTRYRISDSRGPLCRVSGKNITCYGKEDGITAPYALGLTKDRAGNIWFGSSLLWRWSPASSTVYFEEELKKGGGDGAVDVVVAPSGDVWATLDGVGPHLGVRHFTNGKWSSYVVPGFDGSTVRSHTLFLDSHNTLWVGTEAQGLYRIHDGIADHYGAGDGLSGSTVSAIYEDREGNIWVATDSGIDVFRDTAVVRVTALEGLSGANIKSVLARKDGTIWLANEGAVEVIRPGGYSVSSRLAGVPGQDVDAMLEDRTGRVWMGVDERLMFYENGRFSEAQDADGKALQDVGAIYGIVEDGDGNIWVSASKNRHSYLLRIKGQSVVESMPLDATLRRASLAADPRGGIWLASDVLARYRDGRLETIPLQTGEGGRAYSVFVDSGNAVWASTAAGLVRWKDGALQVMNRRNGLPCSALYSAIQDTHGTYWIYANCGLVKIDAAEMAAWAREPERKVAIKFFDALDGVLSGIGNVREPKMATSPDGRLWFVSDRWAHMLDPQHLATNVIPPPVHIEELIADHKGYRAESGVRLPPLGDELQIDYTALSLGVPRKVAFRYKLEGHDTDWQEAGARRQAFYNGLGPGSYKFRVIAANSDGRWNETGATLDFAIAPTWYQTTSVRLLSLIAAIGLVWGLYQIRIAQLSKAMSARFDERLAERLYLARELHDTVLQTIQGSKMVADDALERPADQARMARAMEQLSLWLAQAMQEARAALNSLRTSTTETNNLAAALRRAAESGWTPENMTVKCTVIGEARDMHPIVRDEVYRIGFEAIRNACAHSSASRLDVELTYARDLTVRVADNGVGVDPAVVQSGRVGHFGLEGMRERATRIGGALSFVSAPGSGTVIELIVPGRVIFRRMNGVPWTLFTLLQKMKALLHLRGQTSGLE